VIKLKKFIPIFILALLLFTLPSHSVKADGAINKQQIKQLKAQIKQKQQSIRRKTQATKKIEMHLDSLGNEAGEAFENLFNRETPINENMASKIKDKQKEIVDALVMITSIDSAIKFEKHQAKINLGKKNYQQALLNYENEISLLERQEVFLSAYSTTLQELISLFTIGSGTQHTQAALFPLSPHCFKFLHMIP
jgi:chromosome segregation ATPase